MNRRERYLSFLLRLWQESGGSQPHGSQPHGSQPYDSQPHDSQPHGDSPLWRASLERPQSDERLRFASLADLFAFLEEETGHQHQEEEGR